MTKCIPYENRYRPVWSTVKRLKNLRQLRPGGTMVTAILDGSISGGAVHMYTCIHVSKPPTWRGVPTAQRGAVYSTVSRETHSKRFIRAKGGL